jgi:enolase-phosphatase E1
LKLKTKFVLIDIEGTVSDIHFVKNVMFPYSRDRLSDFIVNHQENIAVKDALSEAANTLEKEGQHDVSTEDVMQAMLTWIDQDRKHPSLKKIQGMIWQLGFESGALVAPLYGDVLPAWKKWKELELGIGIYSSGSVQAQKLFFGHTSEGDVLGFLQAFFDLDVGSKRDPSSYAKIAASLSLSPDSILFLSDIPEELDAATASELMVQHIVRPGTVPVARYVSVESFDFPIP